MTGVLAACGSAPGPVITVTPLGASGEAITPAVMTNEVTASSVPAAEAWSWGKVSGGSFSVMASSSATTAFTAGGMAPGEERSAVYVCDVTINGSVYRSPEVPVSAMRTA